MIVELLETHMQKCDEFADGREHVVSEVHGTSANIEGIWNTDVGPVQLIDLALDDGTAFIIRIEATSPSAILAR